MYNGNGNSVCTNQLISDFNIQTSTDNITYLNINYLPKGETRPSMFYIIIRKITEYLEVNGIPGYQRGDQELYYVYLTKSGRTSDSYFSPIGYYQEVPFQGTIIHHLTYYLNKSVVDIAQIEIDVTFTTKEVHYQQPSTYPSKQILIPDSVKWNLKFKNFTYRYQSTGIAVQFDIVSQYKSVFWSSDETPSSFYPDQVNSYQSIYSFPYNFYNRNINNYMGFITKTNATLNNTVVSGNVYNYYVELNQLDNYFGLDSLLYGVRWFFLSNDKRYEEFSLDISLMGKQNNTFISQNATKSITNNSFKNTLSVFVIIIFLIL